MSTITGTITNGVTLGQAGHTSPLIITGSGTVSNGTGAAVYASGTYANPIIVNHGTIIDTGGFDAVELKDGGSVVNTVKGALIQGHNGIDIFGAAGSVTNAGTIAGTGYFDVGVSLFAGGCVANTGLIQGGRVGVYIGGAAGTVTNSGTIAAGGRRGGGSGVVSWGGSVGNTGLIQGGGFFGSGVYIFGAAGTVTNSGTITSHYRGVYLGAAGAVTNSGTIAGVGGGNGVVLGAGGSVDNTGLIQGNDAVATGQFTNRTAAGTVTNSGTIAGTGHYGSGVSLAMGGSVGNTGLVQGFSGVEIGVDISGVGAVTNSGTIVGTGACGVYITFFSEFGGCTGVAGTVTNSGTIAGTGGSGFVGEPRHTGVVLLGAGGSVANTGKGALIQGWDGVYIGGAAGTVTNSGTIAGTGTSNSFGVILHMGGTVVDSGAITGGSGTAISFGGSGGNLLALEHGYSLGGGVAVAGTGNTLELLGAAGPVTVDFNKSGAGFANFGTVAFGAASGHDETLTITNSGSLPGTIAGFTQSHDIIDLTQLAPKGATATLNISDQLVVSHGLHSVSLQLDPSENYSGVVWKTNPDGTGGTDVTVQHAGLSPYTLASTSGG